MDREYYLTLAKVRYERAREQVISAEEFLGKVGNYLSGLEGYQKEE